jgi:phosphoribosylformylglycinamidine cyclo-ligase
MNSLQACQPGASVRVALQPAGRQATLLVEDTGSGIAPEALKDIFKPYVSGRSDGHGIGLSMVRRLAEDLGWKLNRPALFDADRLLIDYLIEPTRIYVKTLLPVVRSGRIHALAHITGGGLLENVPRVLPKGLHARIDADAWEQSRLMAFLQAQGNIEPAEMARTFNCGIGMVLAVAADDVAGVIADLTAAGETVHVIGAIEPGERGCTVQGSAEAWSARTNWEAAHLA